MSTAIELVLKVWWSKLPVGLHTVFLTTPHPLSVALTVTVSSLNLIMIQTRDFYISVLNLPVEYL